MPVTVTLRIFSERRNPEWTLNPAQAQELLRRISGIRQTTLMKPAGLLGRFDYQGFVISATTSDGLDEEIYVFAGVVDQNRLDLNRAADRLDLEKWLLETAGNSIDDVVREMVKQDLDSIERNGWVERALPWNGPRYDPDSWNYDRSIFENNNCYNYATNTPNQTCAQPGRGGGQMFRFYCVADLDAAAQCDGLVPESAEQPIPDEGYRVALVVRPGVSFHWYRQDSNWLWSHKPGQGLVLNKDFSGELISDPRTCNRGRWTEFGGFYLCITENLRIK